MLLLLLGPFTPESRTVKLLPIWGATVLQYPLATATVLVRSYCDASLILKLILIQNQERGSLLSTAETNYNDYNLNRFGLERLLYFSSLILPVCSLSPTPPRPLYVCAVEDIKFAYLCPVPAYSQLLIKIYSDVYNTNDLPDTKRTVDILDYGYVQWCFEHRVPI